jgi:predicted Rossmann-fold nucleotide-binding protein
LTVQGLHLDLDPPDLSTVDVADTLFVGCHFASVDVEADLVRRGAHVVPAFDGEPYPTHPSRLYTPEEIVAGFAEHGFAGMYDTVVHRHFLAHGGALPDIRQALAQRMHDHGIDDGLQDAIAEWGAAGGGPVTGVMGGHAEPRGTAGYLAAARIGRGLARAGCLVVTGGGPGVMEAANLGAYLADAPDERLAEAVAQLATSPDYTDHGRYTEAALEVRAAFAMAGGGWARRGGLSVPTWLYGHEPANLFAARIAKYFSNAIREDTILRLTRGGIVFAPGRAGTVQEVFQAATKTFYATDGTSGPFVFLGKRYWTDVLPVEALLGPLLAASPGGDQSHLLCVTDEPDEAVAMILEWGAPPEAKEAQRTTP